MSSSYIAGYRIGMLSSGAGSLVLASWLGSTSEAYSYPAWQTTYALMALTMLVGAITTLIIREPDNPRPSAHQYTSGQYLKFLAIFVAGITAFVTVYVLTADSAGSLRQTLTEIVENSALSGLVVESLRLALAITIVAALIKALSLTPLYDRQLVRESYLDPVKDFSSATVAGSPCCCWFSWVFTASRILCSASFPTSSLRTSVSPRTRLPGWSKPSVCS